jgi:hypothetical protein
MARAKLTNAELLKIAKRQRDRQHFYWPAAKRARVKSWDVAAMCVDPSDCYYSKRRQEGRR